MGKLRNVLLYLKYTFIWFDDIKLSQKSWTGSCFSPCASSLLLTPLSVYHISQCLHHMGFQQLSHSRPPGLYFYFHNMPNIVSGKQSGLQAWQISTLIVLI